MGVVYMKKLMICDDDPFIVKELSELTEQYKLIHYKVQSFNTAEALISNYDLCDVLFLDIELPDMSGLEAARKIREKDKNVSIVFITSYIDFRQEAFDVHAFQYLVKPIKADKLYHVLDEIVEYKTKEERAAYLKKGAEIIKVRVKDIVYFEYSERKVKLLLQGGNELKFTYTIQEIYDMFSGYNFASPHRAFVINLEHVERIDKFDIMMSTGERIPLAQKRASDFKKAFYDYLYAQL